MTKHHHTVACLSGDGIGPELMAEASRALAEVSHLHGFTVEEVHLPFGRDAVRSHGHPLPPATRAACRDADAVLVAATREPALEGVKAELDLTWRVTQVVQAGSAPAIVSPLAADAREQAIDRAFALAEERRAFVTSVGPEAAWVELVTRATGRHEGVRLEHLDFGDAVLALVGGARPFDVVVSDEPYAEALSQAAASVEGGTKAVASGRLGFARQGLFGPTHGSAPDIAGQGVANPSGMLLATALLLGEGLGERNAARTLASALAETLGNGVRTPDRLATGVGATTREFVDDLLAALPGARTDTEFAGVAP
jgi:3-isopropylmalate dehydrogenase